MFGALRDAFKSKEIIDKAPPQDLNSFSRKSELLMNRVGSAKARDDKTVIVDGLNQRGGIWLDVNEDDFLFSIDYEFIIAGGCGFAVVLQTDGDGVIGEMAEGRGVNGLRNGLACVFNLLTYDTMFAKPNSISVFCDNGQGIQVRKTNALIAQEKPPCNFWYAGKYQMKVLFLKKRMTIWINNTEVITYVFSDKMWNVLGKNQKYIGIVAGTNASYSTHLVVQKQNVTYLDCPETILKENTSLMPIKKIHFVGNASDGFHHISLINSKNQTSAFWHPIDIKSYVFIQFTVQFELNAFEGFAIVLQSEGSEALGEGGKGKGYTGISDGIAVEWSCLSFRELNDPPFSHVAIMQTSDKGISNNHNHAVCSCDKLPKDMWRGTRCDFRVLFSSSAIVCWLNGVLCARGKCNYFDELIKRKLYIGATAASTFDTRLAISNLQIHMPN